MEVVAGNFEEAFPDIVTRITACDFAAIDCEFTGLDFEGRRKEEYFDDLEQRYARVRTSAQNFLVIQVGLSLFEWDAAETIYKASTYNCYVYPRSNKAHDHRFSCQASSLEFLSKHNFDFNKFVNEGVPFLSLSVADQLCSKLEQESPNSQQDAPGSGAATAPVKRDIRDSLKSDEDKRKYRDLINRVRQWLDRGSTGISSMAGSSALSDREEAEEDALAAAGGKGSKHAEEKSGASVQGEQDPHVLLLEPMNSFWRAAVYQMLEREFGKASLLVERVPDPLYANLESIRLVHADRAAVLEAERTRAAEKRAHIDQSVGFSRVFRALSEAKKPIVGHNMLLDLAYTFQLFVQPLPPIFDNFRNLVSSFFSGGIYDTKHLALQAPDVIPPFSGTGLEAVFLRFSSRVSAQERAVKEAATAPLEGSSAAQPRTDAVREGADTDGQVPETAHAGSVASKSATDDTEHVQALEASVTDQKALPNPGVVLSSPPLQPSDKSPLLGGASDKDLSEVARFPLSGSTGLPSRTGATEGMPRVKHAEGFSRYLSTHEGPPQFAHEAGYDAFMTGVAFLGLAKALEVGKEKEQGRDPQWSAATIKDAASYPNEREKEHDGSTQVVKGAAEWMTKEGPGAHQMGGASTRTLEGETVANVYNVPGAEAVTKAAASVLEVTRSAAFDALVAVGGTADASALALSNGILSDDKATMAASPVEEAAQETEGAERALFERARQSPVSLEAVRRLAYRINLMYTDLPHLPLQGPLVIPERGHLFYLSRFAEGTRSPDLAGLFAKLGLGDVDITWINRSSAFVALRLRSLAHSVIEKVTTSDWAGDIVTWADYRLQRSVGKQEHLEEDGLELRGKKQADERIGRPTKGRRLDNGRRYEVEENEEDGERNERRLQKASARRTCTIL